MDFADLWVQDTQITPKKQTRYIAMVTVGEVFMKLVIPSEITTDYQACRQRELRLRMTISAYGDRG